MTHTIILSPFNQQGERKYLNANEREEYYSCALTQPLEKKLFCQLIYYTGARISEIHQLSTQSFDFIGKLVIIRSLKKRRKDTYRQIPIPDYLINSIYSLINEKIKSGKITSNDQSIWWFSSRTASRIVKNVMIEAGIEGPQASAKGLRHAFAVHAVTEVPLTKVQKWMGHADLKTTAIYLQVSGMEERMWAEKMWSSMRGIDSNNVENGELRFSNEDYRKIKINCLNTLKNIEHVNGKLENDNVANENLHNDIAFIKSAVHEIYSTLNVYDIGLP